MALPDPVPGLVIGYSYLWKREAEQGREEGQKDRPCVIVLAVENNPGETTLIVAPITHSPPDDLESKILIPPKTRKRLGLDEKNSWVVISEVNRFVWPGPDLRPVPGQNPKTFEYGLVPAKLFEAIKSQVLKFYQEGELEDVPRTE